MRKLLKYYILTASSWHQTLTTIQKGAAWSFNSLLTQITFIAALFTAVCCINGSLLMHCVFYNKRWFRCPLHFKVHLGSETICPRICWEKFDCTSIFYSTLKFFQKIVNPDDKRRIPYVKTTQKITSRLQID